MQSKWDTVEEYLESLPSDRRRAIEAVRQVVLDNLDTGIEEGMSYGMIGYFIPHSIYPSGYHCDRTKPLPFASLASQKNYMSLYLMCFYGKDSDENWLREEWLKTGKKLDMGKSCIRFKKLEDLPLELIGKAIARVKLKDYIAHYDAVTNTNSSKKQVAPKKKGVTENNDAEKKTVQKKAAPKKKAPKKAASKTVQVKKVAKKKSDAAS